MGRFADAQRHVENLLERAASDAPGQPQSAEMAELEDLRGQCSRGMTEYDDAERWFVKALEHDPQRVVCYDRLARLRQVELRRIEAANDTIRDMVAKNPNQGRAYIYRWLFAQEFAPPALDSDIARALKLAADDSEVLVTAAFASEQKNDAVSARRYWERAGQLDPKNPAVAVGLARLETRERHLDRAEAILRQGYQASRSLSVAFALAEFLIKVDKKDDAGDCIMALQQGGLGDTLVLYLDALILVELQDWQNAIPALERARAVLAAERQLRQLTLQLDLMLAECYERTGDAEERLDALSQAAAGDRGSESARIRLASTLARSGKLSQAATVIQPLATRKPEWRLDLARLLVRRTICQPRDQQNWAEVEQALIEAEKALPQAAEPVMLLRCESLAAQGRLEEARSLLAAARLKQPRNLRYRLALARLGHHQGQDSVALQVLDEAEIELGPSPEIQLARLDYWGLKGGALGKAEVAKLAAVRQEVPARDRPAFLDRLGWAEIRLGQLDLARQYWRELAALQPANLDVRLELVDLAIIAGDHQDAAMVIEEIRKAEGEQGMAWRSARGLSGRSSSPGPAREPGRGAAARRPNDKAAPQVVRRLRPQRRNRRARRFGR